MSCFIWVLGYCLALHLREVSIKRPDIAWDEQFQTAVRYGQTHEERSLRRALIYCRYPTTFLLSFACWNRAVMPLFAWLRFLLGGGLRTCTYPSTEAKNEWVSYNYEHGDPQLSFRLGSISPNLRSDQLLSRPTTKHDDASLHMNRSQGVWLPGLRSCLRKLHSTRPLTFFISPSMSSSSAVFLNSRPQIIESYHRWAPPYLSGALHDVDKSVLAENYLFLFRLQ